jgi:flavin reductase (DIM6/NTAB) family NADH-FMN oxidoreductase RutF
VSESDAFERLVGLLDYPMFVVTAQVDERRAGCLVGFASQTSIRPSRFLVGLSKRNYTFGVARDANYLAVHVLSRDHVELAKLFGGQSGDTVDKFALCGWRVGPHRVPILNDAAAWFAGKILARFDAGDHVAHLVEPVAGESPDSLSQLVTLSDVADVEPGHDA